MLSRLMEYQDSDAVPFHMPGHKRRAEHGMLRSFPNPYSIDITEIEGFDNLHHPEGILKDSMEWAAKVYGADRTYYLVNGSSCGILSAVCAVTHPGGRILMSRNCHKAAYHGVILNGLEAEYVYPQILDEMGIQGGISVIDVENFLNQGPLPEAVLIVSPTYDGVVSDVKAIADMVHRYGIPLIVDEAHGAHFPFGGGTFPKPALECGADVVIQSLHKTLPSFTQTAILHMRGDRVDPDRLERYLQIFQSSSPSYLFMAGIEYCIYEMEQHGQEWMRDFAARLAQMRRKLCGLKHLKLLGTECVGMAEVFDLDLSKIVVSCKGCLVDRSWENMEQSDRSGLERLSGEQLSGWLREEYHLEMEMSGADYVVAITSFMDRQEDLDRLAAALLEIDGQIGSGSRGQDDDRMRSRGCGWGSRTGSDETCHTGIESGVCVRPSSALEEKCEMLRLDQCAGRISAEFIYLYPPGIPILVPGERVTEEIIGRVECYKQLGLPVQGMADRDSDHLRVLCGDGN